MPLMPRTANNDTARAMVARAGRTLAREMSRSFNYDDLAAIFCRADDLAVITADDMRAMNEHARIMLAQFDDRDLAAIGHCAYMLSLYRYGNIDHRIYNLCNAILATRHNR